MHALRASDWPSNIRGLKNPIDNAAIRTPEDQWITPDMLFEQKDTDIVHGSFDEQVAQFEKKIIQDAREQTQGVIAHAAEMLSMDRSNQEGLPDYWGIETYISTTRIHCTNSLIRKDYPTTGVLKRIGE